MPQVPAEPPGTHHQRDSPAERAMSVDSSQVSGHTRARTPPRDGGSIHSSSVKSELPSVKSEQWVRGGTLPGTSMGNNIPPSVKSENPSVKNEHPSVKSEPQSGSYGSRRGSVSIKSEPKSEGMVGSYYGSKRGALSGGVSLKSEPLFGSYGAPGSSSKRQGYSSGHTHNSASSRVLSAEKEETIGYNYYEAEPSRRRDKDLERVGRTYEVKEKRRGYVADTRARRRV